MSDPAAHPPQSDYLQSLFKTAIYQPGLWIVPLMAAVLIALLVGFLGPRQWAATQTFVVREELIGRIVGPGRFESLDTMKTAQETIGELARRPAVLRRTLQQVGPEIESVGADWPSEETVIGLQGSIEFFAPGGAEFGKTEVLTMQVKSSSRERARQLVAALFDEVQIELRNLRELRAASMVGESRQVVNLAKDRYTVTARELKEIESSVGSDLAELRTLNEPMSGTGDLRKIYGQILAEIRSANTRLKVAEQLDKHLRVAQKDTSQLVSTPRALLDSQPILSRLKEKLVDAQVELATVGGNYSARHPKYQAAQNATRDIQLQIQAELQNAIGGLRSQQSLTRQELAMLNERAGSIDQRLNDLARMRVGYGEIVEEMNRRQADLSTAWQELGQAEAIQRAAETVDFITEVDQAQAGLQPLGPSKKTMLLGAIVAGSFIGLGLVMLVTPVSPMTPPPGPGDDRTSDVPRQPRPSNPVAGQSVTTVGVPASGFAIPDITQTIPTHVSQ